MDDEERPEGAREELEQAPPAEYDQAPRDPADAAPPAEEGGGGGGGPRGPPPIDHLVSLKVDNLTYRTDEQQVQEEFSRYGKIGDVYIPRDRSTKESKGFAFVRFYDRADAEEAIKSMNGRDMDGRNIRVSLAERPRPDNPREKYQGGDGGGYDDRGYGPPRGGGYDDRGYGPPRGGGYDRYGPPRGGYDDRGYGPPRGGGYDDRGYGPPRGGGYDDRGYGPPRGGGYDDRGYGPPRGAGGGGGGYEQRGRSRSPPRREY